MIKAFVKDGVITLMAEGRKKAEFAAGAAITTVGEQAIAKNPYTLFDDFDKATFLPLAQAELDRLFHAEPQAPQSLICTLDKGRKNKLYTGREWRVSFKAVDGEAVYTVCVNSAVELLALELTCAIFRGKPLKKCEHCGKYFFPTGRSDSVYCQRVGRDGFSCNKIGAHRQYRKNSRSDDAKKLYDKITKHNRYLKNKGSLPEADYARFMAEASSLYAQWKRGELAEDVFLSRLSEAGAEKNTPARRNEISDYLL